LKKICIVILFDYFSNHDNKYNKGSSMIRILFPLFFILLNIQALGQSEVIYPAENPLYSIIVPKGWTAVEYRDYIKQNQSSISGESISCS